MKLLLACFTTVTASAQISWINLYNGPLNRADVASAIAVDGNGNVFVTGGTDGGAFYDYATIKYSSDGMPLWTNRYNRNVSDYARAIAVDGSGNVFVTGGRQAVMRRSSIPMTERLYGQTFTTGRGALGTKPPLWQ